MQCSIELLQSVCSVFLDLGLWHNMVFSLTASAHLCMNECNGNRFSSCILTGNYHLIHIMVFYFR